VTTDRDSGQKRPSSAVFRGREVSIDGEKLLVDAGLDWHFTVRNWPAFFLVRLTAQYARDHQQTIEYTPQLPENPYHGDIVGQKPQTVCRFFSCEAQWVKGPP
jgi:hypothetical protein